MENEEEIRTSLVSGRLDGVNLHLHYLINSVIELIEQMPEIRCWNVRSLNIMISDPDSDRVIYIDESGIGEGRVVARIPV